MVAKYHYKAKFIDLGAKVNRDADWIIKNFIEYHKKILNALLIVTYKPIFIYTDLHLLES